MDSAFLIGRIFVAIFVAGTMTWLIVVLLTPPYRRIPAMEKCPICGLPHPTPSTLVRLLHPTERIAACVHALAMVLAHHDRTIDELPGGMAARKRTLRVPMLTAQPRGPRGVA